MCRFFQLWQKILQPHYKFEKYDFRFNQKDFWWIKFFFRFHLIDCREAKQCLTYLNVFVRVLSWNSKYIAYDGFKRDKKWYSVALVKSDLAWN